VTRYVHADDWLTDECPNAEPVYGSTANAHVCPKVDGEGYPPGDRLKYMTCKNCGAVIWGFSLIEEHPW
jgi:hypothetical protein